MAHAEYTGMANGKPEAFLRCVINRCPEGYRIQPLSIWKPGSVTLTDRVRSGNKSPFTRFA